jgi:hypothetical protein
VTRGGLEEVTVHCFHLLEERLELMVPRTSVQVQSRSKLMHAMYCITHKIIRLSQVICANGSRKLFRFHVR